LSHESRTSVILPIAPVVVVLTPQFIPVLLFVSLPD